MNTYNLLALIDAADAQGVVRISPGIKTPIRNRNSAKEELLAELADLPLTQLRQELVKKSVSEIDLAWNNTPDGPVISCNLAKLLLLPAKDPAAELAVFRGFLAKVMEFMSAHPNERCDVQICNDRDSPHRRIYGFLSCRVPDSDRKMQKDWDASDSLMAMVDASPILSHWLRQVAKTLQKMGPWSWVCLTAQELQGTLPH